MKLINRFFLTCAIMALHTGVAIADTPVADNFELTIEEQLSLPKIPNKHKQNVRQRMSTVASELQRHKYNVSKRRDGEVITVTLPCAVLFAPNDTVSLIHGTDAILKPITHYAKHPELYKIVISVHSDNTGSENYRDAVTEARANLLCDFFESEAPEAAEAESIIPYGMGHDEPLTADDSMAHRSRNRRVEINIVPMK